MPTYQLNIKFDVAGLEAMAAAGQSVTMVKQSSGGKSMAWISFAPQMDNVITWTDQYSVYSSTINAQSGAVIVTTSIANAIGGSSYTLNRAGYFDPGIPNSVGTAQFQIVNNDPNLTIGGIPMVTAGLVQAATINGNSVSAPICAASVLFNQTALFTPFEMITVYTSSYSNNGIIISQVAGNALTVQYTTNQTASITYNDQQNQFIQT